MVLAARRCVLHPIVKQPDGRCCLGGIPVGDHHFAGVRASADGTVSLTLGGGYTPGLGLSNRFQPYFDIYPIEVSPNLRDWTPLAWLVRTNASTNALTWFEHGAAQAQQRYYRMRTDVLVTPNAPPSGPYLVGRMDRWLTDPTRRNRFLVSTNSSFQVALWYPAEPQAGSWLLPCQDEPVLLDPSYWAAWTDRVPWFVGCARGGLGLAAAQARYPVILMSAGYNALRDDLWEEAEEMASHGYVVLAPEHPDAMWFVLPDGAYESGTTGKEMTESGFRDRVRDLGFVADQVEQWNQNDPFFRDRLDLDRVGAIGFSWGGATASEFSRIDPRCRAVVVLDPGGTSVQVAPPGPPKPSVTINNPFREGHRGRDMVPGQQYRAFGHRRVWVVPLWKPESF